MLFSFEKSERLFYSIFFQGTFQKVHEKPTLAYASTVERIAHGSPDQL